MLRRDAGYGQEGATCFTAVTVIFFVSAAPPPLVALVEGGVAAPLVPAFSLLCGVPVISTLWPTCGLRFTFPVVTSSYFVSVAFGLPLADADAVAAADPDVP